MRILGIETTCDETGASVVEDGRIVLSNVVASSSDLQKKYGGVVPEVAAREQVRSIIPVVREALIEASEVGSEKWESGDRGGKLDNKKSHVSLQHPDSHISHLISNIDAIAVAHGPGLIGSLLIGVETAKTLALAWDKPLVAVNHLVGHVYANWLGPGNDRGNKGDKGMGDGRLPEFPLVGLIVSGGHTDLVLMTGHGKFKLLGSTLDDAAGEAFDKVAKLLGLGYPGGPEIEKLAASYQPSEISLKLPRPMINSSSFDFSFSGLKTAVVNVVDRLDYPSNDSEKFKRHNSSRLTRTLNPNVTSQIAHEFQQAVVDVLAKKTIKAAEKFGAKSIVVGGGVAANEVLRSELIDHSRELGIPIFFPQKNLSVDNGAMIAAAAFYNFKKVDPLKLSADPSLHF